MGFICCFIEYSIHSTDSFISNALGKFSVGDYGPWNFAMVVYVNTFGSDVYDLTVNFSSGQFALVGNLWAIAAIVLASLTLGVYDCQYHVG